MARKLPAPFAYATATTITTAPDGSVAVRYHRTDVATLHPDCSVTLRSGGWRTLTTKRRINQAFEFFGIPARLYQRQHEWYVGAHGGDSIEFQDGITVRLDGGKLVAARRPCEGTGVPTPSTQVACVSPLARGRCEACQDQTVRAAS